MVEPTSKGQCSRDGSSGADTPADDAAIPTVSGDLGAPATVAPNSGGAGASGEPIASPFDASVPAASAAATRADSAGVGRYAWAASASGFY